MRHRRDIAGTRHVPAGTSFAGTLAGTPPTPHASRGDIPPKAITPPRVEAVAPSRDVGPNHLRELGRIDRPIACPNVVVQSLGRCPDHFFFGGLAPNAVSFSPKDAVTSLPQSA